MDNIAVLIRREKELFLKRTENEDSWSPINGEIEKGETHREAVRRKIRNTVEVEIEFEDKIKTKEDNECRTHWYLAEEVTETEENPNPDKITSEEKGKWLELDQLQNLGDETEEVVLEHQDQIKS